MTVHVSLEQRSFCSTL